MRVNTGGGSGGNLASSGIDQDQDEASPLRGARSGRLGSSMAESPSATEQGFVDRRAWGGGGKRGEALKRSEQHSIDTRPLLLRCLTPLFPSLLAPLPNHPLKNSYNAFARSRSRGSFHRGVSTSNGEHHHQSSPATREGGGRRTNTTAPTTTSLPPIQPPLPPPTKHRRKRATFFMMNLAMAFERTDEVVLPAVYSFVAASFGANLLQLSYLTLARALTQALLSPLGGWLGHAFNRVPVLTLGCAVWGAAMSAFAFSNTLAQGIACWAFTGAGLCIVVPNAQSLTADLHEESKRGAAFGTLHLTSALGAALGGLYATNVGALRPGGWDGWRVAMLLLGVAALGIGVLNSLVSADPRALKGSRWRLAPEEGPEGGGMPLPLELIVGERGNGEGDTERGGLERRDKASAVLPSVTAREEAVALTASALDEDDEDEDEDGASAVAPLAVAPKARVGGGGEATPTSSPPPKAPTFLSDFFSVLRVPTFVIIVAQGIVGNVPMAALAFQTLYLQLLGIPASWASAAVSAGFGAHALGGLLGGALGDAAARWSPRHGRVLVCQASVVLGALATLLMLRGLPRGYSVDAKALPPPPPPVERSRAAAAVPSYLAVFILGGLVNAWPAPACNNPIFAEIVPARSRTLVYAFDRSFEMVSFSFEKFLKRERKEKKVESEKKNEKRNSCPLSLSSPPKTKPLFFNRPSPPSSVAPSSPWSR